MLCMLANLSQAQLCWQRWPSVCEASSEVATALLVTHQAALQLPAVDLPSLVRLLQ